MRNMMNIALMRGLVSKGGIRQIWQGRQGSSRDGILYSNT